MDFTGIDIGAVIVSLGSLLKTFLSDGKIADINEDRKTRGKNIDARLERIDARLDGHDESLAEGNRRFTKTDEKLDAMAKKTDDKLDRLNEKQDATTSKIDQLIGFVQARTSSKEWH